MLKRFVYILAATILVASPYLLGKLYFLSSREPTDISVLPILFVTSLGAPFIALFGLLALAVFGKWSRAILVFAVLAIIVNTVGYINIFF